MLDHPSLTRLLDGGVTAAGEPYLVMEYVAGIPIDEYCDQARLDVSARVRIFEQVCDGVAFAHRNLVLHRDLKPSNILVTADGRAKVVDFGTAKLLEPGLVATTSAAPLTPGYASPEQLRDNRSARPATSTVSRSCSSSSCRERLPSAGAGRSWLAWSAPCRACHRPRWQGS